MAKYASTTDVTEQAVNVAEEDLLEADNYIDNLLKQKGIDPNSISLPNETLKILAVYYATYRALIKESVYEDSVLLEKAKQYEKLYKEKADQVDANTLGVSTPSWSIHCSSPFTRMPACPRSGAGSCGGSSRPSFCISACSTSCSTCCGCGTWAA